MSEVCVLGTGMAGYGAAHRLREAGMRPILFDKRPHYGGHTASFGFEGKYTFDEGPHVSFTKHERLQRLFADSIDGKFETLHTKVNNYWKGHWVKHPAQVNLYGLPTEVIVNVIRDFVDAQRADHGEITNYEQWLSASFGNTFAENFPMQYTIKYHTTDAKNMSLDWIGPRLYQAKLEEVLRGALAPASQDVHYISHFRYPSHGGFVSYLEAVHGNLGCPAGPCAAIDRSEGKASPLHQWCHGAVRRVSYRRCRCRSSSPGSRGRPATSWTPRRSWPAPRWSS